MSAKIWISIWLWGIYLEIKKLGNLQDSHSLDLTPPGFILAKNVTVVMAQILSAFQSFTYEHKAAQRHMSVYMHKQTYEQSTYTNMCVFLCI